MAGFWLDPGAGIVAVRPEERQTLGETEWRRLGAVLGEGGKTYVEVEREPDAVPLGAAYLLDAPGIFADAGWPTATPARPVEFGSGVGARHLLSSIFIASVTTPERLTRLLDVSAAIDVGVPCFRVRFDPALGSAAAGEAILAHASEAVAAT